MNTRPSLVLSLMLGSRQYIALVASVFLSLFLYDMLHLRSINHYVILGFIVVFLCIFFIINEFITILLDNNLKIETDYVLIQGFLKSPIFVLEKNNQKMAIFRLESKSHSVFFKIEYNGPLKKGKYRELNFEDLCIKPNKEYFVGATQIKYVYKKMHYIESIRPDVIDVYELKKLYFKSTIKEKRSKK